MLQENILNSIFSSCRLLFGDDVKLSLDFLSYLQPEGLKVAYRDKIKRNHPDRALLLGIPEEILTRKFTQLTRAYDLIDLYLRNLKQIKYRMRSGAIRKSRHVNKKRPKIKDFFFKGPIPKKELRFGMFLFFKGVISWQTLLDSILWQRKSRPRLGQIAVDWNYLNEEEIFHILCSRKTDEYFGNTAIRLGKLTPYQVSVLLGKQSFYKCRIGKYYTSHRILSHRQIDTLLKEFRLHNFEYRFRSKPK
jgi:hypothetical protein